MRRGRKSAQPNLVAHLLRADSESVGTQALHPQALVGFVVSKQVGNAVTRHAVTRRLRHAVRPHLAELPAGSLLVVRALPPSAGASFAALTADVDAALRVLLPADASIRP